MKNFTEICKNAANKTNGLIAENSKGGLMSFSFNYELKANQCNIFFSKESQALKAKAALLKMGIKVCDHIFKTPKFVNVYFKFSIAIIEC